MLKSRSVLFAAVAAVGFVFGAFAVPPVTDHLVVALDASDATSMTLNGDVVNEWRSSVGSYSLKAGAIAYPEAPFQKNDVTLVTENGRQGLRFSHYTKPNRDNTNSDAVYAVMSFGDGVRVSAKTFFFVTRQIDSKYHGAIMGGDPSTHNERLTRNDGAAYEWKTDNYSRVLINGEETLSFANHGGTVNPFVLTATANNGHTIETIGASYLLNGGEPTMSYAVHDKCVIHEILMYDTVLSDEQIRSVSDYLKAKWNLGTTYWTGEGETADWDDAGNWLAGVVPNRTQTAVFSADAAIALTGDVMARRIVNEGASPITLSFENAADVTLDAAIGGAISIEKRGTGTLNVVGGQDYTGETRVLAGTLRAANDNASDVYSKIGGLVTHLDASRADTLVTDANGELLEWKSAAADTADFVGANVAYPDGRVDGMKEGVTFRHANPYLTTDAVGNPAVRFGCDRTDGTIKVGTFIAKKDKSQIKARTYFLVQTVRKFETCGLLGMIVDANFRMYVSGGNPAWHSTGMNESWQNGRKSTGDADRTFEASGSTRPNLLVVRNTDVNTFDIIGGQYLYRTDKQEEVGLGSFLQFDLNEVLMFDTALTDDQIRDISAVLMAKWGVPEQAVTIGDGSALSANSDYLVSADATLDTGNCAQTARSVSGTGTLAVGKGLKLCEDSSDGTALALDVADTLDLNGATLPVVSVTGAGTVTDSSEGGVLRVTNDGLLQTAIRLTGGAGLEKFGEGRLELIPGQDNAGATQVKEGTLAMRSEFDYAALGGLVAHLDASKPSTMTTNEKGELVEWRPATAGAKTFVGGGTLTFAPEQTFNHENPTPRTGPDGRAAVLFGYDPSDLKTVKDTFIKVPDGQITAQTFFVVQTQLGKGGAGGLLGMITDYAFRFFRWYEVDYLWSRQNMNESWVNGRKSLVTSDAKADNPDNTFEASANAAPNLLVVRNGTAKSFDIFGGQYLEKGGSHEVNANCCVPMYVHEVIFFDTALTDEQIHDISATLMDKWNIPRQADVRLGNGLSPRSDFEIAAGATVDLGISIQTLKSAGGSGALVSHGELSFAGVSPYAGSLALAANGLVDLGGGSLSVSNWTGSATVTNSSETTAKLTFTADADTAADLMVVGNVAFEKGGAGALTLPGGQDYTGTTTLDGGSLSHTGFSRYGHVSFHVDASKAETLKLDADGNVLRWDSLTDDGLYLNNAHDAFPDAKFRTAYTHLVKDANGQPCVRFARDEDNVHTGAVMAASSTISGRTEFFVSRQHERVCWGGMIGNVFNYDNRIYRNNENPQYLWAVTTTSTGARVLVNGKETKSFEDPSGTAGPHVLTVVRNDRAVTHEIIGGDWLQKGNADGEVNAYNNIYSRMDLYEVLLFDTALSDDQIREVTAILTKKWKVQVATDIDLGTPASPFAADSDYVVTASTGLDLDGFWQTIKSLTFDVGGAESCPVLAIDGELDVTDTPLAFLNAANVGRGDFLTTTRELTSPFLSVTGLEGVGKVSYRKSSARISTGGTVILVR